MRKTPSFGFASLLVLAVGAAAVFVFMIMDAPGSADPSGDSLAILVDSLGQLIYAAFVGAGAVLVSAVLALISMVRSERRIPAIISLVICIPILFYFGVAVFASMTVD